MNDMRSLILDTAERIFRDRCDQALIDRAEGGDWPQDLWQTVEEAGLTVASVPEEQGGAGGTIGDGLALLKVAGRFAVPLPLAETFLAGRLLAEAGANVPAGPLTVAPIRQGDSLDVPGGALHGVAAKVPWAGRAVGLVVGLGDGVALVDPAECRIEPGKGMSGDPRDTVIFDGAHVQVHALDGAGDRLLALGALARAAQMAGALEAILDMTTQYVQDRVQFGRPISKFQAIQQSMAVLAGQTAAASAAAENAIAAVEAGGGEVEIAVAKARVGEAASIAAELAHQAHGAIGFTHEYALHQFTRRLWTWRDEFGSEPYWQGRLGRLVARAGADSLWRFATRTV